ncbi:MAG: NAD(P)/FAD-dependent oxidoreductase [Proteobacteria bacterium]|nr:NAD(P)/FAD-dependent oxidoreductase [Pseudomonadota bacterium]
MRRSNTIVVGGGPAGAACAGKLRTLGEEVLILDQHPFPRPKVCAGWIQPSVWALLGISPAEYPLGLTRFDWIYYSVFGIKLPVKTRQYAVRRVEFDHWMIARSRAPVVNHRVKTIVRTADGYVIDNQFHCQYLIGAGGTHCPVYRTFFSPTNPRAEKNRIVGLESEYAGQSPDKQCRLWFFDHGLPGYAWYLPKQGGWVNLGIGGKCLKLKTSGSTIMDHWHRFIRKLQLLSLIDSPPPPPKGHTYHLYQPHPVTRLGNAFVVGDAAGLSTLDMGEGIQGAIASGIMAAEAIAGNREIALGALPKFSLPGILLAGYKHLWNK